MLSRSAMASEMTSSNELSESTAFSCKTAKCYRSKKSSSKYKTFEGRKKHSHGKTLSISDSEADNVDTRIHTPKEHHSQKKETHHDYWHSKETNYSNCIDMIYDEMNTTNNDSKNANDWIDVNEYIRNRKNIISEKTEGETFGSWTSENATDCWELVDKCGKESDVSLTTADESSDDFWKCESSMSMIRKEKKMKKKKRKSESMFKYFNNGNDRFAIFKNMKNEWRMLKEDHKDQISLLQRMRNRCAVELLLIFIFCGIGGIIFHSVEGAFEMFYKCGVKRVKRDFVDSLWLKSHYMREDEWKSLARSKLMEFENQLYDAYDAGMTSYSGQKGWSFLNSFVYCLTVITTIGYGRLAPATTIGRLMTIVYSLFGIPLFLILLADYGKLFTRVIKFFWAYVRRLYYTGSCRKVRKTAPVQEVVKGVQLVFDMTKRKISANNEEANPSFVNPTSPAETPALSTYTIDDEFNLPISVAVGVLLLYLLSGAALFMKLEKWSFFESFYFVYISVSTIGFGDIVPSSRISVLLCSLVYFVFGLSLTSMCINVITEKLTDSFKNATAKISVAVGMATENTVNAVEEPS